jgi:secreted trypsin-like serine protease
MSALILRAAVAACAAVAIAPASAGAVVGGTPDTANTFSNVAVLRFIDVDGGTRWRCSGTLIAPNVIITAAHCTEGAEQVYYSFAVDRPTVEPDAPGATGWTLGGDNGDPVQNIYTHPDWDGDLQNNSLDDIGLIILDAPVAGIAPATIAPDGYSLEGLARQTVFTAVGYGIRYVKPEEAPKKPVADALIMRHYTTMPLSNLTSDTIILAANPRDKRAGGGTCSGDSGGPAILDGVVVGVLSWGTSQFCGAGQAGYQRLDDADARAFWEPLLAEAAARL